MFKKIKGWVFSVSLLLIVAALVLIAVNFDAVKASVDDIYNYMIDTFGWFFILSGLVTLLFSLYLMFGPYKDIKIGGPNAKPEFAKLPWAAMMFTTSCGAWLIVYGFLEPIYCAASPAFQLESLSTEALEIGQVYAHFHWGPTAWGIYVPISVALSYLIYNRHSKNGSLSDAVMLAFDGKKERKGGKIASVAIDVIALISAIISPVISIGTGMPLLTALVEDIFNIPADYESIVQIIILAIWVIIFSISVYLGLKKGIKNLSNANVIIAFVLMLTVALFTGLKFVFSSELNTFGLLVQEFPRISTYTDAFGDGAFVRGWTASYWACYFVYMPLMGVFNAKISKGRTIKELVFGELVLCTLGCWLAMGTFGNYSMKMVLTGEVPVAEILLAENGGEAAAILALLESMPLSAVISVFLLIVCFIFLATTMDSSAFSAAEITFKRNDENELAPRWLRITWAAVACVISYTLLQLGGFKVVRSLCYLAGLPLAILAYFIMFGVYKMLKKDCSPGKAKPTELDK